MIATITADEVIDFRAAVAGVEIDYTRTDEGFGPATMTSAGDDRIMLSSGGLDFSSILQTSVPSDRLAMQLVTSAPGGMTWCGTEARDGDARVFGPTMTVYGTVPAGSRAITTVARLDALMEIAHDLGEGEPQITSPPSALATTDDMLAFAADARLVADEPELLESDDGKTRLLESLARALTNPREGGSQASDRGFDSHEIVERCIAYSIEAARNQPTISELCRVAMASESRLRRGFVDVVGMPPSQFFQIRVLSQLRDVLHAATPTTTTVTAAASSLGLTQFGRVAVRYRAAFGETPSETLRRLHRG